MKERQTTKNCKVCGAEIAKTAKSCPQCGAKNKKPFYKRVWFIVFIIICVAIAIAQLAGPPDKATNKSSKKTTVTEEKDKATTKTPSATPSEDKGDDITLGEKNALSKAHDYLSFTAFSRSGLIEQLKYEGFSNQEAVYAAKHCDANWKEQAAKKAQEYLNTTSFSRQGLIDQLIFEGFSQSQAEYGVSAVGY